MHLINTLHVPITFLILIPLTTIWTQNLTTFYLEKNAMPIVVTYAMYNFKQRIPFYRLTQF